VYIDPHTQPLPGDLVSFALSERGAAALNSGLPAAQSVCRAGDRWLKLYVPYHGYDMLLEKYGHSATATLLACESPDDTPVLHPVRNIRRGGRLLFTPDSFASHTGEIRPNAASQMLFIHVASDNLSASPGTGGPTGMTTAGSITTLGFPVAIDLSVGNATLFLNGAVTAFNFNFTVYRDGAAIPSATVATYSSSQFPPTANTYVPISPLMLSIVDSSPPAGVHTYRLTLSSFSMTGGTTIVIDFGSVTLKLREIKR
jgi:hypothetical protein